MEEIGNDAIEIEHYENILLDTEYMFKSDISILQNALVRIKRLENIHLIGLQFRIHPIILFYKKIRLKCFFFKWKSAIYHQKNYRLKKIWAIIRYLYKKMLIKGFIIFRERGFRSFIEKSLNPYN